MRKIIKLLLSKGANINHQNKDGKTALHEAIRSNSIEGVQFLLDHGADVNLEYNNWNALSYAAVHANSYNYEEIQKIMKLLLNKGANINHQDKNGQTALHQAISQNSREGVQLLLDLGADVNIKDNEGNTIFDYAEGDPEINTLLQNHVAGLKKREYKLVF